MSFPEASVKDLTVKLRAEEACSGDKKYSWSML